MEIEELFKSQEGESPDHGKIIDELKSKRYIKDPDTGKFSKELDPLGHNVFDKIKRPDKRVKVDPDDPVAVANTINVTGGDGEQSVGIRMEPVARIALAIQKLIVKRAVSFIFGNPVELDADPADESQKTVLKAIERILYDVKERSMNRKVARNLFSCTEVAELWYPVESKNNVYGFDSKFKLRVAVLSPLLGDTLYPYFDESGDMVAFSREFSVSIDNKASKSYFETYTDKFQYQWVQQQDGWELVEGYPKENPIGKIPVVFGNQEQVEWEDVQILIERLETLMSNFADTNDYHASPKIFVKGELTGFSKKGETGAIIQGDDQSDAKYLAWENAPESVKLEIETLLKFIYTITQTPDISFDAVKGIGAVSGIALKLLFMDAHLKVADHQEVFDEYLQRRLNVIKAFIGKFNVSLAEAVENLQVEPIITPYMIKDEAAELKIWMDANGGNAVMSQKASFNKAGMTTDPDADFEQYNSEQTSKNSFNMFEPTPA
jgi:SPP1 family phage portal protein